MNKDERLLEFWINLTKMYNAYVEMEIRYENNGIEDKAKEARTHANDLWFVIKKLALIIGFQKWYLDCDTLHIVLEDMNNGN